MGAARSRGASKVYFSDLSLYARVTGKTVRPWTGKHENALTGRVVSCSALIIARRTSNRDYGISYLSKPIQHHHIFLPMPIYHTIHPIHSAAAYSIHLL